MPEAGVGVITRFFKLLGAEENSERILDTLCREWNFIKPFGLGEITSSEAEQLLEEIRSRVAHFQEGVLDAVRSLGGQFEAARLTTVPGGDTLESQWDKRVIKFWNDWFFQKMKPEQKLTVEASIASEVIYLPNIIEGSLGCTYDKVEGGNKQSVEEILDSLPKVEGLRWIIGNVPTVNRILANHLQETDGKEYLLSGVWTWTTDTYESPDYGLLRLIAGSFRSGGVTVDLLRPFRSHDDVGVFVLGVPA